MIKRLTFIAVAALFATAALARDYKVLSPSGRLSVCVSDGASLCWSVSVAGETVLLPSEIAASTGDSEFGRNSRILKSTVQKVDAVFPAHFYKKARLRDCYSSMLLKCRGDFDLEVRAYDDAAAYRLVFKKSGIVKDERVNYRFADDGKAYIPYMNDLRARKRYCFSFESYYDEQNLSQMYADSLAITPLAVELKGGRKAVVMDAGVSNYPGMFLKKGEGNSLTSEFAPLPLEAEIGGYDRLNLVPTRRADYIAAFDNAGEKLPWRVVVVVDNDAQLLNCDIAQLLSPACRIDDVSWIKPGRVAWDWWNATNLVGVDFVSGMNTPTYKYYIDFAAKFGLEYIIIDEGWSSEEDLIEVSKVIDVPEIAKYGEQKGVGVILWSSWRNMLKNTEAVMDHYAAMGIKGFKVDFFDRDDQEVTLSVFDLAAKAAERHLLVDFHGIKPNGAVRAYPNIVNIEGVKGLENSKWEQRGRRGPIHDQPRYDVLIPYLRMLCGPLDYTPGAMVNATRDAFFGNNNQPMSQGTRAHQVAMYTIFEAPLQMFADSPSKYLADPVCTAYMARIPTFFDETVALAGEMGEYVALARRKGDIWYIAAMNGWNEKDLVLDLSALAGLGTRASILRDGVNAFKNGLDYKLEEKDINPSEKLEVHLAPAGGWTAIVR